MKKFVVGFQVNILTVLREIRLCEEMFNSKLVNFNPSTEKDFSTAAYV